MSQFQFSLCRSTSGRRRKTITCPTTTYLIFFRDQLDILDRCMGNSASKMKTIRSQSSIPLGGPVSKNNAIRSESLPILGDQGGIDARRLQLPRRISGGDELGQHDSDFTRAFSAHDVGAVHHGPHFTALGQYPRSRGPGSPTATPGEDPLPSLPLPTL